MASEEGIDFTDFELEVNYDQKSNSVMMIANDNTLKILIKYFEDLLQGYSGYHQHFINPIDGMSGNVHELTLLKR